MGQENRVCLLNFVWECFLPGGRRSLQNCRTVVEIVGRFDSDAFPPTVPENAHVKVTTMKSVVSQSIRIAVLITGLGAVLCAQAVSIPKTTGPIPAAAGSVPFMAAANNLVPTDLSKFGYV